LVFGGEGNVGGGLLFERCNPLVGWREVEGITDFNIMKRLKNIIPTLLLGGAAWAAPLDEGQISHNAKWLAHVDVDALEESLIGQYLIDHLKREIAKGNDSNISFNLDEILKEVHSVTAYGTTFDEEPDMNSVLLMQTGNRAQAIVEGVLASMEIEMEGKTGFKEIEGAPFPTYLFGNETYISFPNKNLIMASKSLGMIATAMDVVDNRSKSIDEVDSDLILKGSDSFIFVATANGFNDFKDIPAQARILQKATGGRIAIGEDDSMLKANITLTTLSSEVSNQLARIVHGMLALVSFAEVDHQSLLLLTQNIKVSHGEKHVTIDMSYPTEDLTKMVESLMDGKRVKAAVTGKRKTDERYKVMVDDLVGGEELQVRNVDASANNGHLPYNAIDDDMETYWGAQGRNHWIRFLLGSTSQVREIKIAWRHGGERRSRFVVQKSMDGVKWKDVIYRRSGGLTKEPESVNIPDTGTKWIRLRCLGNNENSMNTISDIRFYGQANYVIPTEASE